MSLRGCKILVTGAAGFIGSHTVEWLAGCGADVRAMVRYSSQGGIGWLEGMAAKHSIIYGDVRDIGSVRRACEGVDAVVHLAALMSIPYSYTAPEAYLSTNVVGTHNVLVAAQERGVKRIVCVSTSEVYGTPETVPIRETHPRNPQSPYAATKVGADALCRAHYCAYNTPVVVVRPFNTYGPRQSTRAVIPHMLLQLIDGKAEISIGNPDAVRDFTFVTDTAHAFALAVATPDIEGQEVQLGTGDVCSIRDLFAMCRMVVGADSAQLVTSPQLLRPDASEVKRLQSDPSRAKAMLTWEPYISLANGLKITAEWLRENQDKYRRHFYE